MTWTAGQKADATIVVNGIRDFYSNPAKDAIRAWVTAELKAADPTLVLDLWGGGRSADELTAAGLSVLSVDDGRGFDVSKARVKRALEIKAEMGGYRAGWGSVAKYAPECDAAWLDFMGHLSGESTRVLDACRHMKVVVVTLSADRMAGVANLPVETWAAMYRAAIVKHTKMSVHSLKRYRRHGGQWVLVMVAHRTHWRDRIAEDDYRSADAREAHRAYARERRQDPRTRPVILARERAGYQTRREEQLKAWRDRYATDPAFREQAKQRARDYRAAHRDEVNKRQRARNARAKTQDIGR